MIKLGVVSHNIAGWAWHTTKESYESRLERALVKLREKDSFITGIHELQLSGGKYIPTIRKHFPESNYELILPQAYNDQPKSVVSTLLIKKDLCKSCSISTIEGLDKYSEIVIREYESSIQYYEDLFTLLLEIAEGKKDYNEAKSFIEMMWNL